MGLIDNLVPMQRVRKIARIVGIDYFLISLNAIMICLLQESF